MERAPLRPVPSRPHSPVDPAEAIRHVSAELSALDAAEAKALALIALAGHSRPEVAFDAGLSSEQLAEMLARARKTLRRRLYPLPGSGWCERAERLISDRIDGALEDPGPARLEVHLSNCSRCVEHERRLVQAQDALVSGFVEATTEPEEAEGAEVDADPAAEPEEHQEPATPAPAALRIVDRASVTAPPAGAEPLEVEAPIALPPADDAPALPEGDEPPALPEADEPPAIVEGDEPPAVAEVAAQPALPEETPDDGAADESQLADVVALPTPPPAPQPEPTPLLWTPVEPRAPRQQVPPPPPSASYPPLAPAPSPTRSRLAETYALRPSAGARPAADVDTWALVGPLLAIGLLAVLMLVFAVLAVGL